MSNVQCFVESNFEINPIYQQFFSISDLEVEIV